jgi:hypothetical protein
MSKHDVLVVKGHVSLLQVCTFYLASSSYHELEIQ